MSEPIRGHGLTPFGGRPLRNKRWPTPCQRPAWKGNGPVGSSGVHSTGPMVCGAYGVVHHFPGGTQEQYEATLAAVHPTPDTLPEGQGSHVAGPSADGWMVTVVHESQNSWKRFRDDTLMPRMQQGIEGGSKRHLRSRRSTSTSRRRRGHRGTTPATNGSTSLISADECPQFRRTHLGHGERATQRREVAG
jgi:hypothetical protein